MEINMQTAVVREAFEVEDGKFENAPPRVTHPRFTRQLVVGGVAFIASCLILGSFIDLGSFCPWCSSKRASSLQGQILQSPESPIVDSSLEEAKVSLLEASPEITESPQSTESQSNGESAIIVLFGASGNGKSFVGNTLLGRKSFESGKGTDSKTYESKPYKGYWFGSTTEGAVQIVDTPGVAQDSAHREVKFLDGILECLKKIGQVQRFLLVARQDCEEPVRDADRSLLKAFRILFGPEFWNHLDILINYFDFFETSANDLYGQSWTQAILKIEQDLGNKLLELHVNIYGMTVNPVMDSRDFFPAGQPAKFPPGNDLKKFKDDIEFKMSNKLNVNVPNPVTSCGNALPSKKVPVEELAKNLADCYAAKLTNPFQDFQVGTTPILGHKGLQAEYAKQDKLFLTEVAFALKADKKENVARDILPDQIAKFLKQYNDLKSWEACNDIIEKKEEQFGKWDLYGCVSGVTDTEVFDSLSSIIGGFAGDKRLDLVKRIDPKYQRNVIKKLNIKFDDVAVKTKISWELHGNKTIVTVWKIDDLQGREFWEDPMKYAKEHVLAKSPALREWMGSNKAREINPESVLKGMKNQSVQVTEISKSISVLDFVLEHDPTKPLLLSFELRSPGCEKQNWCRDRGKCWVLTSTCRCKPGFHGDSCEAENVCQCQGGTGSKGEECPNHNDRKCASCFKGYHPEGNFCRPNKCRCRHGIEAKGPNCDQHEKEKCSKCTEEGYHLDKTHSICKLNQCKCVHGKGAIGSACKSHDTFTCSSCDPDGSGVAKYWLEHNPSTNTHECKSAAQAAKRLFMSKLGNLNVDREMDKNDQFLFAKEDEVNTANPALGWGMAYWRSDLCEKYSPANNELQVRFSAGRYTIALYHPCNQMEIKIKSWTWHGWGFKGWGNRCERLHPQKQCRIICNRGRTC